MKIVGTDNLARETVADSLLIEDVPAHSEKLAQLFCDALNRYSCHDNGGTFYQLKPDDYRLSRGMEDFV